MMMHHETERPALLPSSLQDISTARTLCEEIYREIVVFVHFQYTAMKLERKNLDVLTMKTGDVRRMLFRLATGNGRLCRFQLVPLPGNVLKQRFGRVSGPCCRGRD